MGEPWTPGPWELHEGLVFAPNNIPEIYANWRQVTQVVRHPGYEDGDKADARLISLAPEMAELLDDWLLPMEKQDEEELLRRTERLLARARGES